jgi:hypothetical protein
MQRSNIWVALALGGCAAQPAPNPAPSPSCAAGDTAMVREVLYFGRNRPNGGTVSDDDWRAFLDHVLIPRFPAGLTLVSAVGQWQGKSGATEQEQSEIVTIFHGGTDADRRAVSEVAAEYRRRFQQDAVLREQMPTCARFD